jgi:hypothetical protein
MAYDGCAIMLKSLILSAPSRQNNGKLFSKSKTKLQPTGSPSITLAANVLS